MRTVYQSSILLLLLSTCINAQDYQLVWSDEFDGPEIDRNNWTHESGGGGWGNNEWQYYTDRPVNSYIQDSVLVIQALEESYGNRNYTSARMISRGKQFWQYGKVEARVKLPFGQGLWPAFWMMGENFGAVGWPACGEIDIMEFLGGDGRENRAYGTAHWEHNGEHASYGGSYTLSSGYFPDDFHVFSIIWTPAKIEWYVDGRSYHVLSITDTQLSEFHQEFFILLNVAVGGNWPGYPDATTTFPQTMEVDYVRVYQSSSITPVVSMQEPVNGAIYEPGEEIILRADASFRGGIDRVEFYQDEVKIGETSLYPYAMTWRDVQPGCYSVRAKAIASNGSEVRSSSVQLQVGDACVQAPYAGYPIQIPGLVEAEHFDLGGQNVAYYDSDPENAGNAYRPNDQVDIASNGDGTGDYHIGWVADDEWLAYTVNIYETASYNFEVRTASPAGGSFHIELDGTDLTGSVSVPPTGSWDNWADTFVNSIHLEEGIHTLSFHVDSPGFNLDKINIYKPYSGSRIDLLGPDGGEVLNAGSIQDIYWDSYAIDTVSIFLSVDGGGNWQEIINNAPAEFGVYRWVIPELYSDNCLIRIERQGFGQINDMSSNSFEITYPVGTDAESVTVQNFKLHQNYPNPFNPSTRIHYDLKEAAGVQVSVHDVTGRLVRILQTGQQSAGGYELMWDGKDDKASTVPTGVYFCRLTAGESQQTIKMVFLR